MEVSKWINKLHCRVHPSNLSELRQLVNSLMPQDHWQSFVLTASTPLPKPVKKRNTHTHTHTSKHTLAHFWTWSSEKDWEDLLRENYLSSKQLQNNNCRKVNNWQNANMQQVTEKSWLSPCINWKAQNFNLLQILTGRDQKSRNKQVSSQKLQKCWPSLLRGVGKRTC